MEALKDCSCCLALRICSAEVVINQEDCASFHKNLEEKLNSGKKEEAASPGGGVQQTKLANCHNHNPGIWCHHNSFWKCQEKCCLIPMANSKHSS